MRLQVSGQRVVRKKRIAICLVLSLIIGLPGLPTGRALQAESVCDLTMTEVHDERHRVCPDRGYHCHSLYLCIQVHQILRSGLKKL